MYAWLTKFCRYFRRDQRGVVAVEFGLVLPLLFVILVGVFEFGRYINHYTILQHSLRAATEYAARYPNADDVGSDTLANADTEITQVVRTGDPNGSTDLLDGFALTGGDAPTIQISITAKDDLSFSGNDINDGNNSFTGTADALVIRVQVSVLYQPFVTGFMSNFGQLWMSGYHEQIWIGLGTR